MTATGSYTGKFFPLSSELFDFIKTLSNEKFMVDIHAIPAFFHNDPISSRLRSE